MVIQLKFDLLCMLSGSEKKVRRIVFLFFSKIQDGRRITCYSEELELLNRFVARKQLTLAICWLDFDVHTNVVTVLYFSIINVLCGAGGYESFAPQANLVFSCNNCPHGCNYQETKRCHNPPPSGRNSKVTTTPTPCGWWECEIWKRFPRGFGGILWRYTVTQC